MPDTAFVRVENAYRFITGARLATGALEVLFADGSLASVPRGVVRGRHRHEPVAVEVPGPGKVIVRFGKHSHEVFPWDYLRGFSDPSFRRGEKAKAESGRKRLGARVRSLRRGRGFTQSSLATAAGIGRVTLARLEAGRQSPSLATLEALADALGVDIQEILVLQ